jgi:hypothetical protein
LEDVRPQPNVQQPLQTYSNLTLCDDQSGVVNNVSLVQQEPSTWTNDSLFASTSGGIRGSEGNSRDDLLDCITERPLEITDSEADAILNSFQTSDLEDG